MDNQNVDKEKDWKCLTLTPIKEKDDGSNNYNEFKEKSILELDAAGYYQYVDGSDYQPPAIPELRPSQQIQGLDANRTLVWFTVPGNEAAVATARDAAKAWISNDKKAQAIIVRAVPSEKLYVVKDCKSAHETWRALKNEYKPANALTAINIKQQIIGNACGPGVDPVNWLRIMIQLYGRL